jgi:hypothetical protein
MRSLSQKSLLAALAVLVVGVLPGGRACAQGKPDDVSFSTFDGVELKGTLYPNPGGKRKAVALLLHNFDSKKGGSSSTGNWPALAKALQTDGFVVLAFDFRGFGKSKDVNPEKFWSNQNKHNKNHIRVRGKPPESIEYKDFKATYYPYLVNDIAAAKAYLDRLNDQKACNTSSLIVVGAGQGATLGAMWMANECRRKKDKNSGMGLPFAQPMFDEPESKDLGAGVWLSITARLEGRNLPGPLQKWLIETGQKNKVPMGFAFGKNDSTSATLARNLVTAIKGGTKTELKLTGLQAIDGTKLAGADLLEKSLGTEKWLLNYVDLVMDARGNKEWREREGTKKAYYYVNRGARPILNKRPGDEAPSVDLGQFLSAF